MNSCILKMEELGHERLIVVREVESYTVAFDDDVQRLSDLCPTQMEEPEPEQIVTIEVVSSHHLLDFSFAEEVFVPDPMA